MAARKKAARKKAIRGKSTRKKPGKALAKQRGAHKKSGAGAKGRRPQPAGAKKRATKRSGPETARNVPAGEPVATDPIAAALARRRRSLGAR